MGRHPVKNHTNPSLMKVIHKIHKIHGIAVSGGWRIISGYLISPGAVKRMLSYTDQFNMRIPHIGNIICQFCGQRSVSSETTVISGLILFPGTQMNLIYRHGAAVGIHRFSVFLPLFIGPLPVGQICNHRGGFRPHLRLITIRIGLKQYIPPFCLNSKFI